MESPIDAPRFVLAFDVQGDEVGTLALRAVRSRFDVLYAPSVDEAWLLAREEASHIRAAVVSAQTSADDLSRVLECVAAHAERERPAVLVTGERPTSATERGQVRALGARWALWAPVEDAALRFVLNTAVALPSEMAERSEPRAPTRLMACLHDGVRPYDGIVHELSPRGAFIETDPLPAAGELVVDLRVEGVAICARARVLYANPPGPERAPTRPAGVGVVFETLPPAHDASLRAHVAAQVERLRV